ncbi:MAG: NAD(P)/FAD-dependent oxidoreductase, partial [Nocardioides sp.]
MPTTPRVAVIGSGVAGLTAAHVAAKSAHVTLFEADDRLGGHADTHLVPEGDRTLAIDTGFIVHNRHTYPTLLRLFDELGVATRESEMSLSVRDDASGLEYAGALGLRGLFPGGANLSNAAYLRLVTEIPRFHRRARALLADPPGSRRARSSVAGYSTTECQTLRDFLRAGRFSAYFERHFMEPLVAAVWSCDPDVALDYPARYLFEFLHHHRMLRVFGSPTWRTVVGGSREYVARVAAGLDDVRIGTKVTLVRDTGSNVEVTDGNGAVTTVDAVVVATHPGPALAMLAEPMPEQREVLAAIPYSDNTALLHTDESVLPRAAGARASWNFLRPAASQAGGGVTVTYDLTRLQRLDTDTRYLLTLGGEDLVDPGSVIDRMEYAHPLYDPASVAARRRLPSLATDRIAFAGAYHGWGFHEDGARSGVAAAERLGFIWDTPAVEAAPTRRGFRGSGARAPSHLN